MNINNQIFFHSNTPVRESYASEVRSHFFGVKPQGMRNESWRDTEKEEYLVIKLDYVQWQSVEDKMSKMHRQINSQGLRRKFGSNSLILLQSN
jgi:hypothetical protein